MNLKLPRNYGIHRRLKFKFYVPKGLTKKPSENSVVSDLFPIQPVGEWTTDFELLNLGELALGISGSRKNTPVLVYFFDRFGIVIGKREVFQDDFARLTIRISDYLKDELVNSSSFSVFHQYQTEALNLNGSFLAERGYCGYGLKGSHMKGYVHGNLDALAYKDGEISPIGNAGLFRREYIVQHLFLGPAKYDLVLTNPTNQKVKITPYFQKRKGHWKKQDVISLNPLGTHSIHLTLKSEEQILLKFRSRLYLCRPVIFRVNQGAMDVFHG
jgi:hypothetical protein